jgi:FlaG/FlaF family flagellin (archaellin)
MASKGVSPVVAEVLLLAIAITSVSSAAVFLNDTFDGLQDGINSWLGGVEEEESSEISVDQAYNESGYLVVDVRNDGDISLKVEEDDVKLWTMFAEENGNGEKPVEWEYFSGSSYRSQSDVLLGVNSDISINTTLEFPESRNQTLIEINGPNEISAGTVCFSQGGSCEN